MQKHGENALCLARRLEALGLTVHYPGLATHPQHTLLERMWNRGFGHGGILAVDLGSSERANRLMTLMQERKVGYLAVSLGYFKTLFSAPGHSTSSEIPVEERERIGLSDGLIRFSVGLDQDMERTWEVIHGCLTEVGAA
jgi:methionine-gamma-lyase